MTGFLGALQFLTRIPIHLRTDPGVARSVPWFPVVGALIGLVVGGIAAALWGLVSPLVGATIAVSAGVALTGAFHEDGLADVADAFGGHTPERRREILEDSRHGSYGVAAMTGTMLLRVACVATLPPAAAVAGLIAAHTLGRAGAVGVMLVSAPPPASGLGSDYITQVRRGSAALGVLAGIAIAAVATGWWVLPLIGGVAIAATWVAILTTRAFEGISGDALGAVEQAGEMAALVVVSGLVLEHDVWWA